MYEYISTRTFAKHVNAKIAIATHNLNQNEAIN
jgi:hypothetical protein